MPADWYVNAAAPGGGPGTKAQPWTHAEMVAAINGGVVGDSETIAIQNSGGSYTLADHAYTRSFTAGANVHAQGCNTEFDDGGRATFIRQGGEVGRWIDCTGIYYIWENITYDINNVGVDASYIIYGNHLYYHCEVKNCAAGYSYMQRLGTWLQCYFHDFARTVSWTGTLVNCLIADGPAGTVSATTLYCLFARMTSYGTNQGTAFCNVYDLDGNDAYGHRANGWSQGAASCIFVGSRSANGALYGTPAGGWSLGNNFHDNTLDRGGIPISIGDKALDPQFVDPANLDYRIQNTDLEDQGPAFIGLQTAPNYGITPGLDQKRKCILPTAAQVQLGVGFTDHGVAKTGTLDTIDINLPLGVESDAGGVEVEVVAE